DERHYPVATSGAAQHNTASIELLVPTGGRTYYGGLTGVYQPAATGVLRVGVGCITRTGEVLADALARSWDTARIGNSREYVEAIFGSCEAAAAAAWLGAGDVRFPCGLHGDVGSSLMFFGILTRIVLRLLTTDRHSTSSDDDLVRLVNGEVHV